LGGGREGTLESKGVWGPVSLKAIRVNFGILGLVTPVKCKILPRKKKENLNKWEDIPYSWMVILSTVKMSICTKYIQHNPHQNLRAYLKKKSH
jgi:hypothetical protein